MAALTTLTTLPPFLLASALSLYGLSISKANITRLQKYESASEKAAQWSSTAAQRLRKTRATQASGTAAVRAKQPPSYTPRSLKMPSAVTQRHRRCD